MRQRYNKEQVANVVALYLTGISTVEVTKLTGVPSTSIHRMLVANGANRTRSFGQSRGVYRDELFKDLNTEEAQYWLGFLAADGYIGGNNNIVINLSIKDELHLDKYIKYTNSCKLQIPQTKSVRAYFNNIEVSKTLNSYGLTPRKSLTLDLKVSLTSNIVRGVFDGDGSISISSKNPKFSIATGSEKLAGKLLIWFYQELGYLLNFNHWGNLYFIETGSIPKLKDIYDLLYLGSTVSLARKKTVFGLAVGKPTVYDSANSGNLEPAIPSQQ